MNGVQIVVFGVSHHHAPVEVRERIRFALFDGREMLMSHRNGGDSTVDDVNGTNGGTSNTGWSEAPLSNIREMVLLSTCNRVELYACVADTEKSTQRLLFDLLTEATREARRRAGFQSDDNTLSAELINRVTYHHQGEDAVRHLFRVACGLDSMVLGETQILTQINDAYEGSRDRGLAGPVLSAVFRAAHRSGRKARRLTDISRNASSVSSAAIALAGSTVDGLATSNIAVVGMGEMGQLALKTLYARGARHLHIVNRTLTRATALAEHISMHTHAEVLAHPLTEFPNVLHIADVVLTATGAENYIIGPEMVRQAQAERAGRELVFIDISVPRNVDPEVANLADVRLFDTDAVESVRESGIAKRRREIPKVEAIIEDEMEHLLISLRKVEFQPLVSELRKKAEAIRRDELERTHRILGSPDPETWSQVQRLTASLVNKLYYYPTKMIKEEAARGDAGSYAATIRDLFGLSEASESELHDD